MLAPMNTTIAAVYVAVATNISVLLARIATDNIVAKIGTPKETVTRLLVIPTEGKLIISIGTTSAAAPIMAIMNRANLSTNGETSSGGKGPRYSCSRLSFSFLVYVRQCGR